MRVLDPFHQQKKTRAAPVIHGAVEADRRNGMMLNLGRDRALYAELFKR